MNTITIILAVIGGLFLLALIATLFSGDEEKINDMSKVELNDKSSIEQIDHFKQRLKEELEEVRTHNLKHKQNQYVIWVFHILSWIMLPGSIFACVYSLINEIEHVPLASMVALIFSLTVLKLTKMLIKRNKYINKLEKIIEKE